MHLMAWSNELWFDSGLPDLKWDPDAHQDAKTVFAAVDGSKIPPVWALHFQLLGDNPPDDTTHPAKADSDLKKLKIFSPENVNKILNYLATDTKRGAAYKTEVKASKTFIAGLTRIRRALANVATYMIFDDHEISDDWNFSKIWKDRVMTSPLGRTILRNGLMAYTLFQGWGNDPNQFIDDTRDPQGNVITSPQKQLLEAIPQMFPGTDPRRPTRLPIEWTRYWAWPEILPCPWCPPSPGTIASPDPGTLFWCWTSARGAARPGEPRAPQNLSEDAVKQQLPTDTDPTLVNLAAEIDAVLVISSLVVLGPPIFDALFGPLSYKIFDIKDHMDRVALPATDPDAIESWPNDEPGFERLLNALAPLKRVVLLSGDVHYSTSVVMSYWKDRKKPPARIRPVGVQRVEEQFRRPPCLGRSILCDFSESAPVE